VFVVVTRGDSPDLAVGYMLLFTGAHLLVGLVRAASSPMVAYVTAQAQNKQLAQGPVGRARVAHAWHDEATDAVAAALEDAEGGTACALKE
jgi:hypothetical protein